MHDVSSENASMSNDYQWWWSGLICGIAIGILLGMTGMMIYG